MNRSHNMLNNSSPKMYPCGTPKVISSHESILVYCFLPAKSLCIPSKRYCRNRIPLLLLKDPERDNQTLLISLRAALQKIYLVVTKFPFL